MQRFLTDLRTPLRDAISPRFNVYVFTLLFHLLDEGSPTFHQPILQILYHLLFVSIDACSDSMVFRNKVPQWFASVAKFANTAYWSEALQVLNTCLKQAEAGRFVVPQPTILNPPLSMWLDYTVTGSAAVPAPKEISCCTLFFILSVDP